jgi:hypothetical protein
MTMSTGMPMPTTAKMMWKASETAIWERAARRSDMPGRYSETTGGARERSTFYLNLFTKPPGRAS